MKCKHCGTKNSADARFCRNCGKPMTEPEFVSNNSYDIDDDNIWKAIWNNYYAKAVLLGILGGIIIVGVLVLIAICFHPLPIWVYGLFFVIEGFIVKVNLPCRSILSVFIVGVLCFGTYCLLYFVFTNIGYSYAKNGEFYFRVYGIGSFIFGAIMGAVDMD